jgi:hypothetical protein
MIAGLALLAGLAWGGETRHVLVEPGLGLDVEILSTEAGGFRVRLPQGERLLRFNDVLSLEPIERDAMAPPDFEVVLLADQGLDPLARAAWATIPNLEVVDGRAVIPQAAQEACGTDPSCLASAYQDTSWRWIVRVSQIGDTLQFESVLPGRESVVRAVAPADAAVAIRAAAQQAIDLEADGRVPAELLQAYSDWRGVPAARPKPGHARSVALGFVPFPGLPSLVQGDYGGFGGALGTAVATSAAWVGLTGTVSTSRGEHAALGAVGAYLFTVASNQLFLQLHVQHKVSVGVVPIGGATGVDGAALVLGSGRF